LGRDCRIGRWRDEAPSHVDHIDHVRRVEDSEQGEELREENPEQKKKLEGRKNWGPQGRERQ
jgi:hypothetical protein